MRATIKITLPLDVEGLKKQKRYLLNSPECAETLGLINLIDTLQDHIVAQTDLLEEEVFEFDDEGDEEMPYQEPETEDSENPTVKKVFELRRFWDNVDWIPEHRSYYEGLPEPYRSECLALLDERRAEWHGLVDNARKKVE